MSNAPNSVLDALKGYIQTEMEGHQFYRIAAERTEDSLGKKMFNSLANDELDHARKLSGEYSSISQTGHWLTEAELAKQISQGAQAFEPLFPTDRQQIENLIPEGAGELEALKVAIDIEKESIDRYNRAAAEVPDEAAKALFQHLVVEERQHLKMVESSYEYLTDTGSWFQDMEKPIFEG